MVKFSGESESFPELIFGFLEEVEDSSESSCGSSFEFDNGESIDGEDDENASNSEESDKAFWESQEELLKATLFRTTSIETKIRQATKEALREINSTGVNCVCRKMEANSCRSCTQKEISGRLQNAGYNCVICKSKWRHSTKIPSGEHSYMEVVQNSGGNGEILKIIIELNFRAQFEMARSSEEYDRLINQLPEVFVGKFSRLQNLIKILCASSKKCMKERKMHMAPWRKHQYMLAKWQGSPELEAAVPMLPGRELGRAIRPRTSMLTFDLLENFPGLHCSTMIRVI